MKARRLKALLEGKGSDIQAGAEEFDSEYPVRP